MRYVIIGNSAAATAGAESIRSIDPQGDISMLSGEKYYSYAKPLISYYLAGKTELKNIYYRSADFYSANQIELRLGTRVTDIDPVNKRVTIHFGQETMPYDKLLVATGSMPVIPAVMQGDHANVFAFQTLEDVCSIKSYINGRQALKVVIIGGGLVGLKAAESLLINGQSITVIEASSHILNTILDQDSARIVSSHLECQGVKLVCDKRPVGIDEKDRKIIRILLENGEEIKCDLVINAAGMKPAFPNIKGSERPFEHGIPVNDYMQTVFSDVYAAGDVAEGFEILSQTNKRLPIMPAAYHQGQIAGWNMAGRKIASEGQIAFNSIPLLGLSVCTAGISNPDRSYEFLTVHANNRYKRLVVKNNTLQGFVLINAIERAGIYRHIIKKQAEINAFKAGLLADDFSLADLPEEFSREVFLA